MLNESSGEESDIDDDGELALPKTTLAQALDSLQVVRKNIQEQKDIGDEIFSALNVIETSQIGQTFKNNQKYLISLKNSSFILLYLLHRILFLNLKFNIHSTYIIHLLVNT